MRCGGPRRRLAPGAVRAIQRAMYTAATMKATGRAKRINPLKRRNNKWGFFPCCSGFFISSVPVERVSGVGGSFLFDKDVMRPGFSAVQPLRPLFSGRFSFQPPASALQRATRFSSIRRCRESSLRCNTWCLFIASRTRK